MKPKQLYVDYLLQGLSNREIADRMGITEHGAKYHMTTLLREYRVESRLQLALTILRERSRIEKLEKQNARKGS